MAERRAIDHAPVAAEQDGEHGAIAVAQSGRQLGFCRGGQRHRRIVRTACSRDVSGV